MLLRFIISAVCLAEEFIALNCSRNISVFFLSLSSYSCIIERNHFLCVQMQQVVDFIFFILIDNNIFVLVQTDL